MRKRGLCCRPVSVCPSVRHVGMQTAEDIVKLLYWPGSPIILVFFYPSAGTQSQGELLQQGRKIHGRGKIWRFSTESGHVYRSVKVTKHGTIPHNRYGFLLVCYSNLVRFSNIRLQKCRDLENRVKGTLRSMKMSSFDKAHMTSY